MKNHPVFICLIFLFLSGSIVHHTFAQSIEKFDPQRVQFDKLDKLVLEKINTARDSIGLEHLFSKPELQSTALLHAEYLSKKGKLEHIQGKKKFKTPLDRVLYFNDSYKLAGENIAYVSVAVVTIVGKNKETVYKTYEELAMELVNNWVRSKSHWKNISDSRYTDTGIALVYNEKENRVYAVQVFAAE